MSDCCDRRAEEIAKAIKERASSLEEASADRSHARLVALHDAARIARSFISNPEQPKTRETVLEEAMRELYEEQGDDRTGMRLRARISRALDWKPD